jgi:hypothetical protein
MSMPNNKVRTPSSTKRLLSCFIAQWEAEASDLGGGKKLESGLRFRVLLNTTHID